LSAKYDVPGELQPPRHKKQPRHRAVIGWTATGRATSGRRRPLITFNTVGVAANIAAMGMSLGTLPAPSTQRKKWGLGKWLALYAMVCQAVVPIYFMALASSDDGRIPVCTGSGIVWIALDEPNDAGDPIKKDQLGAGFCPFCQAQSAPLAAPDAIALPIRAVVQWTDALRPGDNRPRITHAYDPPRIRAPPAFS